MLPLAETADAAAGPVQLWHLVTLVLGLAGSVGGSVFGGVKWFGRHLDRLGDERRAERERDAAIIEQQRKDHIAMLDKRDSAAAARDQAFTKALAQQEAACAEARALDREQRAEELKIICRFAGVPSPGDTGKFQSPTGAPRRDQERTP